MSWPGASQANATDEPTSQHRGTAARQPVETVTHGERFGQPFFGPTADSA